MRGRIKKMLMGTAAAHVLRKLLLKFFFEHGEGQRVERRFLSTVNAGKFVFEHSEGRRVKMRFFEDGEGRQVEMRYLRALRRLAN